MKVLLVNPPDPLQIADVERVLGAAVPGMLALELAMGLLLILAFSSAANSASVSTRPGRSSRARSSSIVGDTQLSKCRLLEGLPTMSAHLSLSGRGQSANAIAAIWNVPQD